MQQDYKAELKKIIEHHRGRNNAIQRQELWTMLDIKNMSQDRKMRSQVRELRREGLPIMFATTSPAGYYLPNSLAEVEEGRKKLMSYVRDECITLTALKTYGSRFVQKETQIPMI